MATDNDKITLDSGLLFRFLDLLMRFGMNPVCHANKGIPRGIGLRVAHYPSEGRKGSRR